MTTGLPEDLRTAIRAAVRQALAGSQSSVEATTGSTPRPTIRLDNHGELRALVRHVASLCRDQQTAAALVADSFELTGTLGNHVQASEAPTAPGIAVVTEHEIARRPPGSELRVMAGTPVTPLARERARVRGIRIVTEEEL